MCAQSQRLEKEHLGGSTPIEIFHSSESNKDVSGLEMDVVMDWDKEGCD